MNLKQKFRNAIKRGTGETHLLIKENPTADFSKEIIKVALFDFSYDQQCEPSRDFYIAELIELSNPSKECKEPLEAIYSKTTCGIHRTDLVQILIDNKVLSDQIKKEIQYDCSEDTRKLWANPAK